MTNTPTPRERFEALPKAAQKVVTEEAAARNVAVDLLFPDYVTAQTADKARRAAVVRLNAAGYERKVLAAWFGVSITAIIKAIKGVN